MSSTNKPSLNQVITGLTMRQRDSYTREMGFTSGGKHLEMRAGDGNSESSNDSSRNGYAGPTRDVEGLISDVTSPSTSKNVLELCQGKESRRDGSLPTQGLRETHN